MEPAMASNSNKLSRAEWMLAERYAEQLIAEGNMPHSIEARFVFDEGSGLITIEVKGDKSAVEWVGKVLPHPDTSSGGHH